MQNGRMTPMNSRQSRSVSFSGRSERQGSNGARERPMGFQNAQRSYERYLELARAEVQAGDIVAAENYYQHAEHYFRSMSPVRDDRGN
jgi:hypothetical protein